MKKGYGKPFPKQSMKLKKELIKVPIVEETTTNYNNALELVNEMISKTVNKHNGLDSPTACHISVLLCSFCLASVPWFMSRKS